MKHTYSPWMNELSDIYSTKNSVLVARAVTIEDAEFIIRAVNNHEALLKAANLLLVYLRLKEETRDYDLVDSQNRIDTEKAIANAEAKDGN